MSKRKTVTKKAVSMYDKEWSVVEKVSQRYGLNTSAALRFIVNEFKQSDAPKRSKNNE